MPSDTQNGFALLEALSGDVSVESLGRKFDGLSAHTGVKVRPSTRGNIPSALQLLPGQSFYIGKTTLSLVPEEHSELPIHSSGLPDSNFESYNNQVSQISTPQGTARASSTVLETPMPRGDRESEDSTPVLEQITGHAISGRKDSKKWPASPLKREVMRTVRDASEVGYSNSQPEINNQDKHVADAAINEHSRLSPLPEVEIEVDMANATIAKPLAERVAVLGDPETAGIGLGSGYLERSEQFSLESPAHREGEPRGSVGSRTIEQSEPLPPPRVRVSPEEEPGTSSHLPVLPGSKRLPSFVEQVQSERRPEDLDQSHFLQAGSDSSAQREDHHDDMPARKKAKTTTVSHETLNEESQDSRQDEVIFVQRGIKAPTDRPFSIDLASSTVQTASNDTGSHSNSADQLNERSFTASARSKHVSPTIRSDSRPHSGDRVLLELPCSPAVSKPQTRLSDWNTVSASPSNSVEPNSSMRSTRTTARNEQSSSSSRDAGIRIVFAGSSSAGDSKPFLKFLSSKGVKKVKSVPDCTVLCVGKELKKTSKVILAVLLGKDIVTDNWVIDSVKGNDLLSIVPYIARDPKKEADWGISLEQAIYRGKRGLKVLQDHSIHFTPSVKKELGKNGFDELKEIAKCAGARSVFSALPKKSPEETPLTVVVATDDKNEVAELQKLGWRAYMKDIISLSVLRGKLDLESDEFLIQEAKKESRKRKR